MTVKKKQSYIVVLDWMVEKYHLKGNELLAYALIYGFSQDEESEYKGSYSYICKWLSIDRATAIRILNRLEFQGPADQAAGAGRRQGHQPVYRRDPGGCCSCPD